MSNRSAFIFLVFVCLVFFSQNTFSQEYGLGFFGHEVPKDNRTYLDITPDRYFIVSEKFELSFSLKLRPGIDMYFGYIARIIDIENNNIDILVDHRSEEESSINIVGRKVFNNISLTTDLQRLVDEWTELSLAFDLTNQTLTFRTPDTVLASTGVNLSRKIKILFGANEYSFFRTTDVTPMFVKDIMISKKGSIVCHFPLDENQGGIASDKTGKNKAAVKNPLWLMADHSKWKQLYTSNLPGHVKFAFNPDAEDVYIISNDQLSVFSVKTLQRKIIPFQNKSFTLTAGCQTFYDPANDMLHCYNIDQSISSSFSMNTLNWQFSEPDPSVLTVFWHHNKHYFEDDSILYIFGGYGQHEYKNLVLRYDLKNHRWDTISPMGDAFHPRYLSAKGELNDTIYLLGGYGSISGSQMLHPMNYSDLMAFTAKDNTFTRLYEMPFHRKDIVFANSMIINPDTRNFYALYHPFFKHDGYLQLIQGNISPPGYTIIGDRIPYIFHDIQSFADLYYCQESKMLVAVTSFINEQNISEVSIYSIAFPPNPYTEKEETSAGEPLIGRPVFLFLSAVIIAVLAIFLILPGNLRKKPIRRLIVMGHRNAFLFFGGFQVFNRHGQDITVKFTPLLRELFLIIWFYTLKEKKGISSEMLIDMLWFNKSTKSAKNNKAVNIAKLKHLLTDIESCNISRVTGYWKLDFDSSVVYNDYMECLKIVRQEEDLTKEGIDRVIDIVNKGPMLYDLNYEWLDEFKGEISNIIIDRLIDFVLASDIQSDPDLFIRIADTVFYLDIINEEAMVIKSKAFIYVGKHSLAHEVYKKFAKDFQALYGESYKKSFKEIIKG